MECTTTVLLQWRERRLWHASRQTGTCTPVSSHSALAQVTALLSCLVRSHGMRLGGHRMHQQLSCDAMDPSLVRLSWFGGAMTLSFAGRTKLGFTVGGPP